MSFKFTAFKFTLSRAIVVFGIAAILGLGAIIGTASFSLNHLKVGGPLYDRIKSARRI